LVAISVAATAPVLAWFNSEPKLENLTLVMAIRVFAHSLSMVHDGLLRRQMKFAAVTVLEISAVVAGVMVGVTAALLGAGYWALVFQQTAVWITQSVGAQLLCRWRPARRTASASWRDPDLQSMFRYGRNLSAARLLSYFGRNADTVFVGYFAGPSILGLYQKANQWAQMPFSQIYGPLLPVAVASFSRLQDDPQRYRSYVRTTLLGCFALTLPATLLLLLDARAIVLVLLGSQWDGAIPFFRILTVGAYFGSFALVTKWLYLAEGRTGDQLRWSSIATSLTVAAIAVGASVGGAMGVARAFAIATILLTLPGIWYCLRRSPLRWSDFFSAVWRPTIASLLAAGAFIALRSVIPDLPRFIYVVLLDAAIFSTLYVLSWLVLPGGRAESARVLAHLRLLRPS
jgi:PST family polysaccharide transporter